MHPRLAINDYDVLRSVAREGIGIALLPEYQCLEDVNSARLRRVLDAWAAPGIPIFALYPSTRHLSPKVVSLLELLRSRLAMSLSAPARKRRFLRASSSVGVGCSAIRNRSSRRRRLLASPGLGIFSLCQEEAPHGHATSFVDGCRSSGTSRGTRRKAMSTTNSRRREGTRNRGHLPVAGIPLGGRWLSGRGLLLDDPRRGSEPQPVPAARLPPDVRLLADQPPPGRGRAPASRLRDGHSRLAGERRASRQYGCGRRHRTGRRAMDDSRVGHPPQGVPRRQLRQAGRSAPDGAALGEPAQGAQDGTRPGISPWSPTRWGS